MELNKDNSLSNHDLYDLATKYKISLDGIFMRDRIPYKLTNGNYIINLDDSKNNGSHWTCLIVYNNVYYYFDSMGVVAPEIIHEEFKPLIYNKKQIQDVNSTACGYFCVHFIKWMSNTDIHKLDLYKAYNNLYSDDTEYNDKILIKLLNKINR